MNRFDWTTDDEECYDAREPSLIFLALVSVIPKLRFLVGAVIDRDDREGERGIGPIYTCMDITSRTARRSRMLTSMLL